MPINRQPFTRYSTGRLMYTAVLTISALTMSVGCQAPSILITAVSPNRSMVETQLSTDGFFTRDKIALIDVSGVLSNSPGFQWFGEGENPVSRFVEQLDRASKDRSVKAVILRINSPGGTVVASELMHDEIIRFKESGKPIIAVMMDVAASGGYYIACACDEILAQPSTITGSIGVIMQLFDASHTLEMLGVKADAITSGSFKDAGSPLRTMKPNERALFQGIVNDMYERFVQVVVKGRPKLDETTIRSLANGSVYTGSQAEKIGLVDRIANLHEALDIAKNRANITKARLVAYHRPLQYKPNVYAQTPVHSGNVNLLNINLPSALTPTAPSFMYIWSPAQR